MHGPKGLSDSKLRRLGLNPLQAEAVNKIIPLYYKEFLSLAAERRESKFLPITAQVYARGQKVALSHMERTTDDEDE